MHPTCVALIPARSGSKRLRDKNILPLAGHPVIAYTIAAARESGIFTDVIVSTDSGRYAAIAVHYGAEVPFLRPAAMSGDISPDIEWVQDTLMRLEQRNRTYDCFSILRPSSPFRLPETICRAWALFLSEDGADSLRAVEKCKQHPGKMWVIKDARMEPLLTREYLRYRHGIVTSSDLHDVPMHSCQYQSLPEIYVQNASIEIAWTRVALQGGTIAGEVVIPFLTQGCEGFDVNRPEDWDRAESLVRTGETRLPEVRRLPYVEKN